MLKKAKGLLVGLLMGLLVVNTLVFAPVTGAAGPYVFKLALTDSPELKIGKVSLVHHSYAAMMTFKTYVEKATKGRMKVELYPYGRLGDVKSNLEQILAGSLQGATPPDGNLAAFYKNVQVLSIPYLFSSREQAYSIIDGKFGKDLFNDMAKKSGLRVLRYERPEVQSYGHPGAYGDGQGVGSHSDSDRMDGTIQRFTDRSG
jgi:TRAP-type C4-dicarboxylate transport system substrate-binding protein